MSDSRDIFDSIKSDKRQGRQISLGDGVRRAARATERLPQAVVKVSSYSHGQGRAAAHLDYIARKGDLEAEDPQGNRLSDPEEFKERMDEWAMDFDSRKRSRDTVNIVLSAPSGSELGAVEDSVRDFAKRTFGESNDYLFAIHNDTDNPHGHLMVKMRGYDGEKLNPGKADLKQWRESFAESLRENGVEVDATSRAERGQGKKGKRQALMHLRKRETPRVDKAALSEILTDVKKGVNQSEKPWAVSSRAKTAKAKAEYLEIAQSVRGAAGKGGSSALAELSKRISEYAATIPVPRTRAEEVQARAKEQEARPDIER